MQKIYSHIIATPITPLKIIFNTGRLCYFTFDPKVTYEDTPFTPIFVQQVEKTVKEYFDNQMCDIQFLFHHLLGTPYQLKVWHALSQIPRGTMITYGALALKLGSSPRAVGQACKRNPFPILLPCHRVIGQKNIGGFAGKTEGVMFEIKSNLIKFEQSHKEK